MLSAVCWVPPGRSRTDLPADAGSVPPPPPNDTGDAAPDAGATDPASKGAADTTGDDANDAVLTSDTDEDAVDVSDVLSSGVEALALYQSNADDPVLSAAAAPGEDPDAVYDEEELGDVLLRPTDALVIAAVAEEDASLLAFHVVEAAVAYGDDGTAIIDTDDEEGAVGPDGQKAVEEPYVPHSYVHHDLILPAFPLATAWTDGRVGGAPAGGSYVAVGSFGPAIDVFDVNALDSLEAVVTLGGYAPERTPAAGGAPPRRRRRAGATAAAAAAAATAASSTARLVDGSHTGAVMALDWHPTQREYLASGSADGTVKVWDAETGVASTTLGHHADKVQAVAWSPTDEAGLLTAAFDGRVTVVDVRAPPALPGGGGRAIRLPADVEAAAWLGGGAGEDGLPPAGTAVAVTTEDGELALHDVRKLGGGGGKTKKGKTRAQPTLLASVAAHTGAATALAQSAALPGLLVTGGTDKLVRVWDAAALIAGGRAAAKAAAPPPPPLWESDVHAGAVFSAALLPPAPPGVSLAADAPAAAGVSPFVLAVGGAKGALVLTDLAVASDAVRGRWGGVLSPDLRSAAERRAARNARVGGRIATARARRRARGGGGGGAGGGGEGGEGADDDAALSSSEAGDSESEGDDDSDAGAGLDDETGSEMEDEGMDEQN
ncbi:hypothetical protein BU14_0499s0003 [Porphyra umbilicalis]|uniref:Anaphase-promoting complex subunit 4 WD40 domain-containing protein n=1 Tax=Porphyra umbilicalis TaxID=2786 RepID=A0A1X6NT95_PORUM|nr:hypothetical protein BU14_0499s0003 [Porphyra umbilicalis]|eukprot:OSX71821.1 hypothetical protein BU14_0499s0003 [Porphyra umbilicalis]